MAAYTKHSYDFHDLGILQFLRDDLGLQCLGIGLGRVPPAHGYPFWHAHERQEEVYICVDGSLTLLVDDDEITLRQGDIVRVAPEAARAVGNRTSKAGTVLIMGAMPFDWQRKEEGKSLIGDGVRSSRDAPDWTVKE